MLEVFSQNELTFFRMGAVRGQLRRTPLTDIAPPGVNRPPHLAVNLEAITDHGSLVEAGEDRGLLLAPQADGPRSVANALLGVWGGHGGTV